MKDEIKKILDKFDKVLENYELDKTWGQISVDSICHLFPSEIMVIKDCLTNLQEENKDLSRMCELYSKSLYYAELTDYKSRIEKAIEYIEENMKDSQLVFGINDINRLYKKNMNDLLNILQGVGKDGND